MAITPTGFQVPAISPASLFSSEPPPDNSFAEMMRLALVGYQQQQLQEDAQAHALQLEGIRRIGDREDSITRAMTAGEIVPLDDAPTYTLPGEEIPQPYSTISGPEGTQYEGRQFVTAAEIEQTRRAHESAQPLEIPGEEVAPGTTVGDVYSIGPTGQRQYVGGDIIDRVTQGDKEPLFAILDAISNNANGLPATQEAAAALRASIADDPFLSRSEFNEYRQLGVSMANMDDYEVSLRNLRNADRDDAAAFNQAYLQNINRLQKVNPDGSRVDLLPAEAWLMARAQTGESIENMSTQDREALDFLGNNVRPRADALDQAGSMLEYWKGAQVYDTQYHSDFVTYLRSRLVDGQGRIINPELEDVITSAVGGVSESHLQSFAQHVDSSPYRAAAALRSLGKTTRSSVEELRRAGGNLMFPHHPYGDQGFYRAFEILEGSDFNDVPPGEYWTPTATGATGASEELSSAAARSRYEADREVFDSSLQNMPASVAPLLGRVVSIPDGEVRKEMLGRVARSIETSASEATDPATAQQLADLSDLFRRWTTLDMTQFMELTDSVISPTLSGRQPGN